MIVSLLRRSVEYSTRSSSLLGLITAFFISLLISVTIVSSLSAQQNLGLEESQYLNISTWDSLVLKPKIWDWYVPDGESFPAILVLGGSEGGNGYGRNWGEYLSESLDMAVLALSYHGVDGLPENLESIPLEYFIFAWDWMKKQNGVDSSSLGIMGVSKGGELALLLGSGFVQASAIVAVVPSSLIWQGINFSNWWDKKSSWSYGGKDLPFQPYDLSRGFNKILNFYLNGPENPVSDSVIIPVERINAPILLFSGSEDLIWPSENMCSKIIHRLQKSNYQSAVYHLNFPDAGHYFHHPTSIVPTEEWLHRTLSDTGGSLEGYKEANLASFEKTIQFLKEYLIP